MNADLTLVSAYGDALFQTARKQGVLEIIAQHSATLAELVRGNRKLRSFFGAPNISGETKEELVQKVFGPHFHKLLIDLIRMMIRRGRLVIFFPSVEHFRVLYHQSLGVTDAKIITADPLDEGEKQGLEKALCTFTGLKLVVKYQLDKAVLGGIRFLSGDTLIDSTLSSKLERMKTQFLNSHVI